MSKSVAKGPLTVESVSSDTWHVHGPPASAANIALYHLAPQCDFVVSGPNIGHNAGRYAGAALPASAWQVYAHAPSLTRANPCCTQGFGAFFGDSRSGNGGRAGATQSHRP